MLRDDPKHRPVTQNLSQGSNPKCGNDFPKSGSSLSAPELLSPFGLRWSRTVAAIARRNCYAPSFVILGTGNVVTPPPMLHRRCQAQPSRPDPSSTTAIFS